MPIYLHSLIGNHDLWWYFFQAKLLHIVLCRWEMPYSELNCVRQFSSTSNPRWSEVPRSTLKIIEDDFQNSIYKASNLLNVPNPYHTLPQLSWNSTSLISWKDEGITAEASSESYEGSKSSIELASWDQILQNHKSKRAREKHKYHRTAEAACKFLHT